MNCLEFRRTLGADPNHASSESLAHRTECATCDQYAREMLRLNGVIERALRIPVPELRPGLPSIAQRTTPTRWYAIAASAVLTLTAAFAAFLFLSYPRSSLALDVIAHMAHEPAAMTPSEARVSAELLDGALRAKGLRLAKPMNDVSYLQSCEIRGDFVPHLVVQTNQGPVTVLLLTREKIDRAENFDEGPYHGRLVPTANGALAIIATDASLLTAVASQVQTAVATE